jgi:histone demethylase JARID1
MWLKEVKTSLVDGGQVTIEMLRRLISAGVTLAPGPRCERMMSELQQQLTESERCEERAKTALQAR